jgi:hypothetical protein
MVALWGLGYLRIPEHEKCLIESLLSRKPPIKHEKKAPSAVIV